ncbi:MAG: hypothetical protein Q4A29_09020 [Eubacteriales bacterium]|nr:hypothetical protein [Eubacteriales bacterium]
MEILVLIGFILLVVSIRAFSNFVANGLVKGGSHIINKMNRSEEESGKEYDDYYDDY